MIIQGTGAPIVLLHGVTSSCHAWQDVIPHLTSHHTVYAFTTLGHNGGNMPTDSIGIKEIVDDIEKHLDNHNLQAPFIVGNSMGGWIAIELAKRGRASGVCAISPAGVWQVGDKEQTHALNQIKYLSRLAALSQPFLPVLSHSRTLRQFALKKVAVNGANLSPLQFKQAVEDMQNCTVKRDLLNIQQSLCVTEFTCPITLVWPVQDKLFPIESTGKLAQRMFPTAQFITLTNLGHVPMIDNPVFVARVIKQTYVSAINV